MEEPQRLDTTSMEGSGKMPRARRIADCGRVSGPPIWFAAAPTPPLALAALLIMWVMIIECQRQVKQQSESGP